MESKLKLNYFIVEILNIKYGWNKRGVVGTSRCAFFLSLARSFTNVCETRIIVKTVGKRTLFTDNQ